VPAARKDEAKPPNDEGDELAPEEEVENMVAVSCCLCDT